MKFTKQTLNAMLEMIIDEYFQGDFDGGLWEAIDYVKWLYDEEIDTLEEGGTK